MVRTMSPHWLAVWEHFRKTTTIPIHTRWYPFMLGITCGCPLIFLFAISRFWHAWPRSHNVSDVHLAAQLLGESFDVVAPDEFVLRLKQNVQKDCNRTKPASGDFLESCTAGYDNCGVLKNWTCQSRASVPIFNDFFDHTSCSDSVVSNCFGHLICQGHSCVCVDDAVGSFSSSCSACVNTCGVLSGCDCRGGVLTQRTFDYSSCPGLAVANCFGALICQGEPCVWSPGYAGSRCCCQMLLIQTRTE